MHPTKQVHAEKFIIKHKTYARHEFRTTACPDAFYRGSFRQLEPLVSAH
jgi:hypothetical protein